MKRVWVGVLGGLLIAGQLTAKDSPAKKRIPITEVPSQAAAPAPIQPADTVRVRVGSGNVLTFPSRVIRVAVGDEKIVALHVVESRQVLLQGLVAGRSTVFVWLEDGRRLRYDLIVSPRVEVLENALHDLDPRIMVDAGPDGSTLMLSGKVDDEHVANEARQLAENMLGVGTGGASRVVSLLQFPGSNDADLRLTVALAAVDPRIRLRRMQVGNKVSNAADAVVLEGRVKDIPSLVRAITLAELQLGGVGGKIEPLSNEPAQSGRNRNFSGGGGLSRLQGNDAPASGLAAYVARGLILKSASGRVLSFLEVDELPQIMVSIRVLQVDRGRAKRLGIDYRLDGSDFSAGSFHQPGRTTLPAPAVPPEKQTIAGIIGGNVVGTFVNKTLAVAAAIDFLQQKDVARSVAEPNITTLSGESASVLIGGEVPIPTTTVGNTASVQGFLFQDFGVRLDIRPTLAPSGLVAMEISPSIIRPSSDLAVSGVPGFQVQSVQTTAKVAPGQTLVLGGLISFSDEIQKRGVPGLSEIPLMKHLFSWEGRTLQEQEILFVITPRILAEGPDQVAEAIQWRDVEPITAGAVVELPSADLNTTANIESATLGHDGLPPSFTKSATARRKNSQTPAIIEDHAPPPPPPPSHSMVVAPAVSPMPEAAPSASASSIHAEDGRVTQEPQVVATNLDSSKPPIVEGKSEKQASVVVQPAPASPATSSPQEKKTAAAIPTPKSAEPSIERSSKPSSKTVDNSKTTAQPIVNRTPSPIPVSPLASTNPLNATVHATSPRTEPSKTATIATNQQGPAVLPVVQPKKTEPVPSHTTAASPSSTTQVAAKTPEKQPLPVPSSTAVQKKSEPALSNPPVVRSVTSAPSPTPPPATSAAKSVPPPVAQSKPSPPVGTPYPYRPREPETAAPAAASKSGAALASAQVNDEIRARLTKDYQIEVIVSPHAGDAWTRLARRVTGDARHWQELARLNGAGENLTSETHVRVPFDMLKPELQQEVVAKLLPKGSAAEADWKRMSGQH